MLTISKPLSAGQAARYHAEEFQNGRDNYYSEDERIVGTWHGRLAAQWHLAGDVREEDFRRLADGQHPTTGEQLVRHQTPAKTTNARGETVAAMEHRAGWDATFSAPKTVSLTALVGGDTRVREAHEASVDVALNELERYVQARLGGNRAPETTRNWVAAKFEHDSARPVDGYAAPQLHTHVVVFNLTETADGDVRPLQPRELYKTQQYATAVYRSELATRLNQLGYEIERGKSGQPEISGYSEEYVEASSPRRKQIEEHLAKTEQQGAAAAQIAAHQTREAKLDLSHDEVQQQHGEMARAFGNQPSRVVVVGQHRAPGIEPDDERISSQTAMTFSRDRNLEREAVVDERALLRDALSRSMGQRTVDEVRTEFDRRAKAGEFIEVERPPHAASRLFTTPDMIDLERDTIRIMRDGVDSKPSLTSDTTRQRIAHAYGHLTESQRSAVDQVLASQDQVQALEGVAGAGKTTALAAVRDAAEREGYRVEGFAPTSRAAYKLAEAGIPSSTLQHHLTVDKQDDESKRLYVLDESSLASTKQMHAFLHRLGPEDRVLLVGDVRQHEAVDAGRPYHQLQEAGIATAHLTDIVRQKDPALREVVEHLSRGEVRVAVERLDEQGRVHEIRDPWARLDAIAKTYVNHPEGTLVVSPDNRSRIEINEAIHRGMQTAGYVDSVECKVRVLVTRQEITGADRQWAERYDRGDVVRYTAGSKALGLERGSYARVECVTAKENRLTVEREDGGRVTYDPRRLQGVTVYREETRAFAVGDRVQTTSPDRAHHVANRELGTVEVIDERHLRVRLDSGRHLDVKTSDAQHLDYGYAVTSHSSQGQTANRVLVHVDTEGSRATLVNQRLAYVAISRGRFDAEIYTNDKSHLADTLQRDVAHRSALEPTSATGSHAMALSQGSTPGS